MRIADGGHERRADTNVGRWERLTGRLPRSLRFIAVGMLGLLTDLSIFSILALTGLDPLLVRLVSLACATVVTWRLNRAFTFNRTGRHQGQEAMRYGIVTLMAQGASYAVFAVLVLTTLGRLPQAALLIGAAVGGLVSYNGHRLFAFAPFLRTVRAEVELTAP
jgi:putative flippase GtrA